MTDDRDYLLIDFIARNPDITTDGIGFRLGIFQMDDLRRRLDALAKARLIFRKDDGWRAFYTA
jgi:hypothetical protein